MGNPVLVEALRGRLVESRHCGAVAVVDADGRRVMARGDAGRPIYPRSAIKALQALPLIESGAADRFGLGDEELALACASHSGEPAHVAAVERMLRCAGLDATALACGTHWPLPQPSGQALARAGRTAAARPLCTTPARANTRASCAPPARCAPRPTAASSRRIRCSAP